MVSLQPPKTYNVAMPADDAVLTEIVRRLVPVYKPERIYLFGSAARDDAGEDSDYDIALLVAPDTPPELKRGDRAFHALRGIPVPIDVLILDRKYFESQLGLKASLASTIEREGRLLYAA